MKNIFTLLFLILLFNPGWSQTKTYPTPEYSSYPYYFDHTTNKLIGLEKATAKMESKTKAMGYGGSSSGYKIDGETSSVTIPQSDTMEFVLSTSPMMNMMDPGAMISLYELKAEKGDRMAIMQENKGMFGKNSSNDANKIPFFVKKLDDKMVLVVPKKLPPGEYTFISMMNMSSSMNFDAYCFRIE